LSISATKKFHKKLNQLCSLVPYFTRVKEIEESGYLLIKEIECGTRER